jgi:hypothetical protein
MDTYLEFLGGYEVGPLLIADSERMADCSPSSIAPSMNCPVNSQFTVAQRRKTAS